MEIPANKNLNKTRLDAKKPLGRISGVTYFGDVGLILFSFNGRGRPGVSSMKTKTGNKSVALVVRSGAKAGGSRWT